MTKPSPFRLTWFTTGVVVMATFLASMAFGIWMVSHKVSLIAPLFQYNWLFYLLTALAPAVFVFVIFARKHPSGRWVWLLFPALVSCMFFCYYLVQIIPAFYLEIKCDPPTYTGLVAHQDCVCRKESVQVNCSLDGQKYSPFLWFNDYP